MTNKVALCFTFLLFSFSLFSQQWKKEHAAFEEKFKQGDFITAETYALACLKAAEQECAKTDSCYENALINLTRLYEATQNPLQAINYWSELFKLQTTRIEKIDQNFGLVVSSYYDMFKAIQEIKVAINVYKRVIERLKKIKEPDNTIYYDITSIYTQALAEQYNPDHINSDEILLNNTRNTYGEKSDEYLRLLDSLCTNYKNYGKFQQAKSLLIENRNLRINTNKNNGMEYARTCTNLGYIYFIGQKADSAILYYSEGIAAWKKYGKTNNPDFIDAFMYYSMSFQFKQDWAKSCELYEEILPLIKTVHGQDHFWYSTVLVSLGSFNRILKNNDKAEKYYLEDIQCKQARKDTSEMNYLADYWGLAGIYELKGNFEKAALYNRKINNLTLENIRIMISGMNISSEKKIAQGLIGFQFCLDMIYSFMSRHVDQFPDLAGYIYTDELVKKGMVMRVLKSKMESALSSKDTFLIQNLDRWLLLREQISKLSLLPISERKSNMSQLEIEAKKIEDDIYYKLYTLQKDKSIATDWRVVQKALKPGEATIEFFNFDYFDYSKKQTHDSTLYYALILKPGYKYPKMISLFSGQIFQEFLQRNYGRTPYDRVKRLYTWPTGAINEKNRGDSLYSYIWKPLEKELEGIKTIYYSPSGLLHKISFNAIPLNDSLSLIDRYHLRQMTNTAMLLNKKDSFKLSDSYKALLYGGIFYDLDSSSINVSAGKYKVHGDFFIHDRSFEATDPIRGGGSWNFLDGTLKEVNIIDSMFIGNKVEAKIFSHSEAVEESFRYSVNYHPEIIHIATHGFFLPEPPPPPRDTLNPYSYNLTSHVNTDETMLRSGLLFAGANSTWQGKKPGIGLDDGILTAFEISRLNLSRTKLVVLSACETGLGEIKGSEGVFGLQRAFKLAGVDFIIMSLWQIPDEQTVELMRLFYSAWLGGKDIRDAFHYAQQEMNKKYEQYFWAAFVLLE